MADDKKKEAADTPAADNKAVKEKPANGNKMLLLGLIAGVLVVNTAVAFLLFKVTTPKKVVVQDPKHAADSLKKESDHSTHVGATTGEKPIDATVNIAGTDGERFLKVAVAFEYDDVKYPEIGGALEMRAPKIKDILIDHLSKLSLIEVTEPEAKDKIRKDLLRLVNNSIPSEEGRIRDVYIVNFIIQ